MDRGNKGKTDLVNFIPHPPYRMDACAYLEEPIIMTFGEFRFGVNKEGSYRLEVPISSEFSAVDSNFSSSDEEFSSPRFVDNKASGKLAKIFSNTSFESSADSFISSDSDSIDSFNFIEKSVAIGKPPLRGGEHRRERALGGQESGKFPPEGEIDAIAIVIERDIISIIIIIISTIYTAITTAAPLVETVDNVIPEAYIEKTPFPAKMKEYSVISSAVNKSEKKPKEPEEQIKIEPAVAIVKDLVTENVEDGHIIFCEDASNIVSHPNKSKQVSVPMLSVRIGDHCYYGLCDIGASVSAIPYELYTEIMHEIGSCELEDIDVVIHLANRETISPIGIVRDVEVLCGKIKYPADFLQHLENSESEAFRKERDELEEIFLRQPILKHDLPVEDLGTTPPPKEDPVFDLKPLPDNLKYAHIDDKKIYPVIISSKLSEIEEERWVSPVHCVPKKGGMTVVPNDNDELIPQRIVVGYRMCIDFRKVNKVTKKDHYPLPFIDQMLERLSKNTHFCFLDGYSGFSQIALKLKIKRKPLLLVLMELMLIGRCSWMIFVYGNSFDNCLRNLDKVLQRCEETNLVLNWEKCHFMVNEGIVLGHKISERGIEVDRAKVEAIEKMPYPRDVKDRKGADNPVADNLSRLENIAYDPVPVNDSFPNEQLAVIKGALPPALDLDSFPCVEEAIRVADEFCDQYRALRREVEILQEENQRLRRMLEYYSNPSTRPSPPHSGNNESLQVLVQNCKIEKLKLKEILMKRERIHHHHRRRSNSSSVLASPWFVPSLGECRGITSLPLSFTIK
ncbi:hypothetical protein QYE76_051118 [Lolium multiflorum]|uniref:Reverse transcriptase domain-containing protein n=1 Tax=Lolium multiflorum TaxID=4521 RepID=A0AAD8SS30_LOLMU|nr:hypothetical protein QYE76_051118 [Lolium multiflorum]